MRDQFWNIQKCKWETAITDKYINDFHLHCTFESFLKCKNREGIQSYKVCLPLEVLEVSHGDKWELYYLEENDRQLVTLHSVFKRINMHRINLLKKGHISDLSGVSYPNTEDLFRHILNQIGYKERIIILNSITRSCLCFVIFRTCTWGLLRQAVAITTSGLTLSTEYSNMTTMNEVNRTNNVFETASQSVYDRCTILQLSEQFRNLTK